MPTVSVDKAALFKAIGNESMTSKQFEDLCFDFGIELDDEVDDETTGAPTLKIDIPANRYDMLCLEGIAMNLNAFLKNSLIPKWSVKAPADGQLQQLKVNSATTKVRPLVAASVLRGIKFNQQTYNSFISLQDKLHQNLARQRTLASIGTHDLDTIQGPFTYDALPPDQIKFAPLNQTKEMTATELMTLYEKDSHLGRYLHIIRDSPVYPIIKDSNDTVLSLPPIINSNHSKITLNTRNVFLELTGTDRTKLDIVNDIMVTMFSCYCEEPFTVEPVEILSPHNGQSRQAPDLNPRPMQASASYINSCCGLDLPIEKICDNLARMGYNASPAAKSDSDTIQVLVPPNRADILHQADVMEDAAIAYGFNVLPRTFPTSQTQLFSAPLPINKLSDIIRIESATAEWVEALSLALCSHDENFAWLQHKDDGTQAVKLQNPQTQENQIVRTRLLPGLLKCVRENKRYGGPIRFFEVADVVYKDLTKERKARNERHFCAVWYAQVSGFEEIHGLLDRIFQKLRINFKFEDEKEKLTDAVGEYWLDETDDPMFFPGRGVSINVSIGKKMTVLGSMGIMHPLVLEKFELSNPVSIVEINIEPLL